MTVNDFKKTMFQIDTIVWVSESTGRTIDFPKGESKIVDAYFHAENGLVYCAVYIAED